MTALIFLSVLLLIPVQVFTQGVRWTAETGKTARLGCDHGVLNAQSFVWELNNTLIVYKDADKEDIKPGYKLEIDSGKMYLMIFDVKKESAGNYKCSAFYSDRNTQNYKVVEGLLEVKALGTMIQSSLAVLVCGLLLQMLLLHP